MSTFPNSSELTEDGSNKDHKNRKFQKLSLFSLSKRRLRSDLISVVRHFHIENLSSDSGSQEIEFAQKTWQGPMLEVEIRQMQPGNKIKFHISESNYTTEQFTTGVARLTRCIYTLSNAL